MKKIILFGLLFLLPVVSSAAISYSESINLSSGWNIVSTPRILESHEFSIPVTSDNFDIFVLNSSSTSGWSTLADLGQTEFTPLFGYFINNKSTSTQTLTFNYKASTTPNQRLFERTFTKTGWYSIGVANPTYAKKTSDNAYDVNNPRSVLNSIIDSLESLIDLTSQNFYTNPNNVAVGSQWKQAISSDINSIYDLREGKGYVVYLKAINNVYTGFQNDDIQSTSTPTLVVAATSTLTVDTLAGGDVEVGTLNKTIWATNLNLEGGSVNLKGLKVKVIGSIPSNSLQNIKLYVSGFQVATSSDIDGNGCIIFDLSSNPYLINSSKNIEVRADVVSGSSRTFTISLQNVSDLQLYDSNYNIIVVPILSGSQSSGTWTVSTGSVTVSLDSSLSSGDVVTGASNVPLARYTFKAYGEDMKISYLQASTSHVGGLQNVSLHANGLQIGSTQTISAAEATANTPKLFSLGSSLVIPAGQTVVVEIRGDIKNADGTNATTTSSTSTDNQITMVLAGYASNAQGSYSQQLSTVPAVAGVTGPTMTVVGGGLVVTKNASVSNYTIVPNTINQKIGSYILSTNSVEPVRITNLSIALSTSTNISNLYVAVDGSTPTTPISPQVTNNFAVDFTIPVNSSKGVDVYADIGDENGSITTTLGVSGYGVMSNTSLSGTVQGQEIVIAKGELSNPILKTGSGYSPDAQFVVGDTTQVVAYFNATSSNGTSVITEMTFAATGTGSTSAITEITVGGKTAPVVSGVATVSGLSISVPVGYAGTNIPVSVKYNTVGLNGITSGLTAGVRITALKYTSGNTETSVPSLTAESNLMTVVGSKPTLAIANPSDNTVGAGGSVIVARVTVLADAKGPVTVTTLPLSMQAAGAGSSAGTLTVKVGGSTVTTSEGMGAVGTTTAATGTITFTGGYEVAAGTSVTFDIWDTVTFTSTDDSLRTSLGSSSLFTWTDVNGNSAGLTGASIYNYPTNTALIAY
jgi:hypothetical protein